MKKRISFSRFFLKSNSINTQQWATDELMHRSITVNILFVLHEKEHINL